MQDEALACKRCRAGLQGFGLACVAVACQPGDRVMANRVSIQGSFPQMAQIESMDYTDLKIEVVWEDEEALPSSLPADRVYKDGQPCAGAYPCHRLHI